MADNKKSISSDNESILNTFNITSQDKDALKGILSNYSENDPPTLFYSLTHLKHNYITLTHLFNLSQLSKLGFNIIIALWDMNILSNPYFKKNELEKNIDYTFDQYIQKKRDEILEITTALGIEKIKIYNSSEIWARLIQQKDHPLFAKYYTTLSTMDLDEHNINAKINYLIQLPADLFFANFFNTLYPEDAKKSIEVMYSSPERKYLYFATRKAMYEAGIIDLESPLIIMSNEIPRIEIDTQIPHWDMSQNEIHRLITKWHYTDGELEKIFKNVIAQILPELTIKINGHNKTIKTKDIMNELEKLDRETIVLITSKSLFDYFQKSKELMRTKQEPTPDFLTVKTRKEANELGALLKSDNTMQILALANGTRTITEIAKVANMQLSNTSQYINKLEKAGLLRVKNKKVYRAVKGIKINFDASITQKI
jgi:predicted transcriptional regulator